MVVSSILCGSVTSINVLDLVMVTGRVVVDLELGIRLSIEVDCPSSKLLGFSIWTSFMLAPVAPLIQSSKSMKQKNE